MPADARCSTARRTVVCVDTKERTVMEILNSQELRNLPQAAIAEVIRLFWDKTALARAHVHIMCNPYQQIHNP